MAFWRGCAVHYRGADHPEGNAFAWETIGWIGTDLDRLWIRSEGESIDGSTESANVELFYGRAIARWWDGVVGIRHDFGEGPSQTFAGIGVIGMAPYKFEVEATAYIGEGGQTAASVEVEYDTLDQPADPAMAGRGRGVRQGRPRPRHRLWPEQGRSRIAIAL